MSTIYDVDVLKYDYFEVRIFMSTCVLYSLCVTLPPLVISVPCFSCGHIEYHKLCVLVLSVF